MLKVIKDRVLIEIESQEKETMGGIILPDIAESRDSVGTVRRIGSEVKSVTIGDRVIYNNYSELIEHDGKKYRLVQEKNVLCLIDPDNESEIRSEKKQTKGTVDWEDLD